MGKIIRLLSSSRQLKTKRILKTVVSLRCTEYRGSHEPTERRRRGRREQWRLSSIIGFFRFIIARGTSSAALLNDPPSFLMLGGKRLCKCFLCLLLQALSHAMALWCRFFLTELFLLLLSLFQIRDQDASVVAVVVCFCSLVLSHALPRGNNDRDERFLLQLLFPGWFTSNFKARSTNLMLKQFTPR